DLITIIYRGDYSPNCDTAEREDAEDCEPGARVHVYSTRPSSWWRPLRRRRRQWGWRRSCTRHWYGSIGGQLKHQGRCRHTLFQTEEQFLALHKHERLRRVHIADCNVAVNSPKRGCTNRQDREVARGAVRCY